MFRRVRNAVADVAETLRRAYAGLPVVAVMPEPFRVHPQGAAILAASAQPGLDPPGTVWRDMRLLEEAVEGRGLEPFQARLCAESGWARWGAEAEVIRMAPLAAGLAARIAVPPLPRSLKIRGGLEAPSRPTAHRLYDPLRRPGTRRLDPTLDAPAAASGLNAMLSLPIPIKGEDIQRLAKGLWMRYSLQLVRGTGENVRNLEVLGLFRIPRKGVADLRHDPRQNRILIRLEAAATRAPRVPFILARRKDDGALMSCFVEDP